MTIAINMNVLILIWIGVVGRILAYISLSTFNRDKMGLLTLSQMSIYWIVNPIHDWLKARKARKELQRRRAQSLSTEYTAVNGLHDSSNPFLSNAMDSGLLDDDAYSSTSEDTYASQSNSPPTVDDETV